MQEQSPKVAFHTLGCKLNYSETSTIARAFAEKGFERVDMHQRADVYVINTCSVTHRADSKCREVVKKALKLSPDAFIAVVGCYAQLKPQEIAAIPGVSVVLGANDKFRLFERIEASRMVGRLPEPEVFNCDIREVKDFEPSYSMGDRTRAFLKVQDGCNYFCTFCTIPLARGRSRNGSIAQVLEQARAIAARGIREVVLTGVNIGDFGRSTGERFIDLLRALDQAEGIERFRISSIEPNLLTDEIIEFVAGSKRFAPHFHLPLQSGSDEILALMRRKYRVELYRSRVAKIRALMPEAFIGVDLIVGFTGETEEHFDQTFAFLSELDVSFLHVFSFSERENTAAAKMTGRVPDREITRRSQALHRLSDKKHREFYLRFEGQRREVLFEKKNESNGKMYGYTDNYLKVEAEHDGELVNQLVRVELGQVLEQGCFSVRHLQEAPSV